MFVRFPRKNVVRFQSYMLCKGFMFYLCFCIYLRVLMSNKIFISTMFVSRNSNTTDSTGETEIAHTY